MHDFQASIAALSERQHGAVAVRQLSELGLSHHGIENLIESGQWARISPVVLRRLGAPRSRGQRVSEAVLDAGADAALSHRTATAWWRIPGFALQDIEVMRLRSTNSTPARLADTIHEPRSFPEHHRTTLNGVVVTIPSRLPFDVAQTHPWLVPKVLDRAWAANLLSYRSCCSVLEELAGRGRKGVPLVRELLQERGPNYRPNDTNLEDRFQQLAREAGFRDLERQRDILDREWLGRVDFVDRRRMLIFEVDSAYYHGALVDQAADRARTEALEAAGYRVERFTDAEIWFDPAGAIQRLRRIHARTGL